MSGREWKPGDVAALTDRGGSQEVGFCISAGRVGGGPVSGWRVASGEVWSSVASARPLVVIDPEDREAVRRVLELFGQQFTAWTPELDSNVTRLQAALREFANPTPPKPEEPTGLGAVVEDRDGIRWVRSLRADVEFSTPWRDCNDDHFARHYDAIEAVRVLSEGIQ